MIQDARYTSPSGTETAFEWETGKRKTELKTGVFTFPGKDGAHVQHQGAGAKSFPLVCIFSGDDCMEKADAFEAMLIERGVGELQHPLYGTVKVVPTGDIEREDDPVNKYGESTVSITFTETLTDEAASELTEVAAQSIEEKLEEFNEAAVADFAAALIAPEIIDDVTAQASIVTALEEQTQEAIDNLQPIVMTDKKASPDWLTQARELKDNIKTLYQKGKNTGLKIEDVFIKALNIGRLTLHLLKTPANLMISITEKIKGYSALAGNLINQYKKDPFGTGKIKGAYAASTLALTGACASLASGSALSIAKAAEEKSSGSSRSSGASNSPSQSAPVSAGGTAGSNSSQSGVSSAAVNKSTGTGSREEAVVAANQVTILLDDITAFQDTKIETDEFIDAAPAAHIALQELVFSSVQLILNASFALPMQKTITIDRDRQVIELCTELYGTPDYLDEFIIENNFNLDEIVLLPQGKKVSYYVKSA